MQPDLFEIKTSTIMEGISQGEFVPYLQPQMDASIGSLWGAEALVRWISPKYGFIMPGDFIPQLEKTDLVCKIDYYIFEEVCKLKRKWKNENLHYAELAISINMSRRHFDDPDFVDTIVNIARKYDIPFYELDLEITENIFLENMEHICDVVKSFHELGFQISIDDFGSGYSSLGMLKDVDADCLKLDKTFVDMTGSTQKANAIIRNVISMGLDLHMKVISEGVETESQKNLITTFGCEIIQGYYYSKPLPVDEFEAFAMKYANTKVEHYLWPLTSDLCCTNHPEYNGCFKDEPLTFDSGILFPSGKEMEHTVLLPNTVVSPSYTVSFWINPMKKNRWASAFFIRYRFGFMGFCPYVDPLRAVFRIAYDKGEEQWHDIAIPPLELNTWTHIAITMDAASHVSRLYINGELQQFLFSVPVLGCVEKVVLGGDYYQNSFCGRIRQLRIAQKADLPEVIQKLYKNSKISL